MGAGDDEKKAEIDAAMEGRKRNFCKNSCRPLEKRIICPSPCNLVDGGGRAGRKGGALSTLGFGSGPTHCWLQLLPLLALYPEYRIRIQNP